MDKAEEKEIKATTSYRPTLVERETIINFNEGEKEASVYTFNKSWQRHFEQRLGIVPISINSAGGREYMIDKKRIKPPRARRKISQEQRKVLSERAKKMVAKRIR